MALIFGLDVSHHQPILNWKQAKQEGVEFAFLKATEGSTFKDDDFLTNLNACRAAGIITAAYHYVRNNASVASQVANVVSVVPKDVPVILDVEANSGGVQLARDITTALRSAEYKVPLLYLPRWYWQQIGSPSLAGLPVLWSSRYPDNIQGTIASEYAQVPGSYWNGYGGLNVAVLQFTSSARVAGYAPLDANAFMGTREQLNTLLYGTNVEDDMESSELVVNPATGQPALDTNGNHYTYGAAWYYDNLNGWYLREELDALSAKVDALTTVGVDVDKLAGVLAPMVAKAVNDELARRQAE